MTPRLSEADVLYYDMQNVKSQFKAKYEMLLNNVFNVFGHFLFPFSDCSHCSASITDFLMASCYSRLKITFIIQTMFKIVILPVACLLHV